MGSFVMEFILVTEGGTHTHLGVKVKKSRYRRGGAQRSSRKLRFPDFMITVQDGGKVVSLTHRPPLPTRKCSWYSFLLEAESTPGPQCGRKEFMSMKNSNDTNWD